MRTVVYLRDDPKRTLYFKDSVPWRVSVVKPDSSTLIKILLDKLNHMGIEEADDWLTCAIYFMPPELPVYYRQEQGISCIYDKKNLEQWFKLGNTKDPGGLNDQAKLSHYVVAKPEDILKFVIKTSGLELDDLVQDYKVQKQIALPEQQRLISTMHSEDEQGSCFKLFKRRKKIDRDEVVVSSPSP